MAVVEVDEDAEVVVVQREADGVVLDIQVVVVLIGVVKEVEKCCGTGTRTKTWTSSFG